MQGIEREDGVRGILDNCFEDFVDEERLSRRVDFLILERESLEQKIGSLKVHPRD